MLRSIVTLALVLGFVVALSARRTDRLAEVTCRVPNDPDQRTYVLSELPTGRGKAWHLSYKSKTVRDWIRLRLPGAAPAIAATSAVLSYKSANGGIAVDLNAGTERASLDVYVSYELEVNVDASLSPEIDALNTHGLLAGLTCGITGATGTP
jgi:hypothetical protein